MDKPTLWINGRTYSVEELKKGNISYLTAFEKNTLQFCSDWLNGKSTFEIQTSGSTGTPKQISFTRNQLEVSAHLTEKAIGLKKNDTALICLDTQYIAGQMMLVRSMLIGMNIVVVEPSANPFESLDESITIDFVALVPYQLKSIIATHAHQLNKIRCAIIGGAPLSEADVDQLQNYSCSFYATYGMTETISHIALRKLNGVGKQNSFHPLPTVRVKQDERGCLVIHAPHVSEDDLITNDLVELNDDQSFKVLGRWDNVINTGGIKIATEALEEKIQKVFHRIQLSNRFFIAGFPDEKLGNKITLLIEGEPMVTFTLISEELKKELTRFELPKEIKCVGKFIETATQKIDRKKTTSQITTWP